MQYFQILSKQSVKAGGRASVFVYNQVSLDNGIVLKRGGERLKLLRSFILRVLKNG